MSKIESKTIVFISGAYVNHACWSDWSKYFEGQGYTTITPPWPGKNGDTATLLAHDPDPELMGITIYDVVQHYINIINTLPEKPIIIGHSFGGLLTQVLLNKGHAAAGIAIHPVPVKGVFPYEINFLRSNAAGLGFFSPVNSTYIMPFKKWQFAFTNGLSLAEQKSSYKALVIPESRRAIRGGLTDGAKVDFKKKHNPLLLLAGTTDQCIPAHLVKRVSKRYKSGSVVEFVEKDRNHYVLGLPTWKEDAAFVLNWIKQH